MWFVEPDPSSRPGGDFSDIGAIESSRGELAMLEKQN